MYQAIYDNNRDTIDTHILDNNEKMDTQAGFNTGCQIEDNLFALQYCIDQSFINSLYIYRSSIKYL